MTTGSKRRALARLEAAARARLASAQDAAEANASAEANAAWSAFSAAAIAAFPERAVSFNGPQPFVSQPAPTPAELGGFVAFEAWVHRIADGEELPEDGAVIDGLPDGIAVGLQRHWGMTPREAAGVLSEALRAF